MYFVYRITNKINNKNYIGSSTISRGYETRWKEHIKSAQHLSSPSYNYPLQKAIRKYGIENFSYEIIEDHIATYEERVELEYQNIIKFQSLTKEQGYNQTLYTECALADEAIKEQFRRATSKRCALVNEKEEIQQIFLSLHEAAKYAHCENGVSNITRICNGETRSINNLIFRWIDENDNVIIPEFKTQSRRTKIVAINVRKPKEKTYFNSISEASSLLSLNRSSIQKCLQGQIRYSQVGGYIFRKVNYNNDIIENDIPLSTILSKYIEIDNEYKTLTEWCKYFNISSNAVYYRMKKYGVSKQEALLMIKRR